LLFSTKDFPYIGDLLFSTKVLHLHCTNRA
jgi:hypothetical protein